MKVKISPSGDEEQLADNLERRVEQVETAGDEVVVETSEPEKLAKIPGVESFKVDNEEHKGLAGKPVDEEAYAKIDSREDAVKAFLATVQGYDLRVINTEREWDLRRLKQYNPDIKEVNKPSETFEVDYTISDVKIGEKIEIEMPEDEEVERIYREFLA